MLALSARYLFGSGTTCCRHRNLLRRKPRVPVWKPPLSGERRGTSAFRNLYQAVASTAGDRMPTGAALRATDRDRQLPYFRPSTDLLDRQLMRRTSLSHGEHVGGNELVTSAQRAESQCPSGAGNRRLSAALFVSGPQSQRVRKHASKEKKTTSDIRAWSFWRKNRSPDASDRPLGAIAPNVSPIGSLRS
jgi:hypothetical protein